MALFTSQGLTYPKALDLINKLKQQNIPSNITVGGVAIQVTPDQINQAREICLQMGASFDPGYSQSQENLLLRESSSDAIEHLKSVTDNAIALIKEWSK